MKTKLSTILIILTLLSSVCFAETAEPETNSQTRRQDKKWFVTGQAVGIGPIPGTTTSGFAFGYFINPDLILSAEAVGGNSSGTFFDFFSNRKLRYNSAGMHLKNFLSTNFYIKGGVDYNRFSEDYSSLFFGASSHGFESEFYSGAIAIGNQWQFSHFTIGCDWVGYTLPISSKITSEYYSSASEKTYLEDDESRYTKMGGAEGLRFYLGFSW